MPSISWAAGQHESLPPLGLILRSIYVTVTKANGLCSKFRSEAVCYRFVLPKDIHLLSGRV